MRMMIILSLRVLLTLRYARWFTPNIVYLTMNRSFEIIGMIVLKIETKECAFANESQ